MQKAKNVTAETDGSSAKTENASAESTGIPASAQASLVTLAVFLAYMGQMLLNPIIAPLAREMGLREWHIGATISFAAVVVVLLSGYWGRASQRLGAKRILMTGLLIATIALAAFSVISYLGVHEIYTGVGLALGVMITRGLLYGAGISAVAPTAQTHLVTHTPSENGRVKAVGMIGAAQGIASIIGGLAGGGLAAVGGLLLPLWFMPVLMLVGILLLAFKFHPNHATFRVETPKRIKYTDSRVLPWLIGGLLMFFVFSSVQTIFGFTIQDRFALSGKETAGITAIYLFIMGIAMIFGQGVLAHKLKWGATKLFRFGLLILLLGVITLWPVSSYALLAVSMLLVGIGAGLAMPGYNSGPTLQMDKAEQGAVAGLINANNGIAYALAPVASTTLYEWNTLAPFIVGIVVLALVTIFCFTHPLLRK